MVSAILLVTLPPLADQYVPFLYHMALLLVLLFIPVVAIESYVLVKALRIGTGRSIKVAAITNAVSTVVGIPLAIGLGNAFPARFYRGHLLANGSVLDRAWPLVILVLLVPFFIASWGIEYPIARLLLKHEEPPRQVSVAKAVLNANLASYALLLLVTWSVGWNASRPDYSLSWGPALRSVRDIDTAEITYASTYGHGYSPTLAALGPPPRGETPSEAHAGLIDHELATGKSIGYTFTYTPGPRDAKGEIQTYTLTASPLKYEESRRSFFSDHTGVIRETSEDRPATANDTPVAG